MALNVYFYITWDVVKVAIARAVQALGGVSAGMDLSVQMVKNIG